MSFTPSPLTVTPTDDLPPPTGSSTPTEGIPGATEEPPPIVIGPMLTAEASAG